MPRKIIGQAEENAAHSQLTFDQLPVGTRVRVVAKVVDMYFFYPEHNDGIGTVIRNTGEYLGVRVKFDIPREYTNGYKMTDFNFNPHHLEILEPTEDIWKAVAEELAVIGEKWGVCFEFDFLHPEGEVIIRVRKPKA